MRFVNQLDYPNLPYRTITDDPEDEYGKNTTFATSGCGLASCMMVADRLVIDPHFEAEDAVRMSFETKANYRRGTSLLRFAPAFCEKFGLRWESTDDPEKVRHCLRTGGVAVAHCKAREGYDAVFTVKGHYITLIAEEEDGRIVVLDPSYKPGKYDTPERRGKVELKAPGMGVVEMQILIDETAPKKPHCFYLFWRK